MEHLLNKKLEQLEARRAKRSRKSGFTLVELAIVLVIIGLIIGGVLVGQDLIKAAEIRATITQLEQYNAAVNTFRGRFSGLPGDIRNATSFFDTTLWNNLQNGNGNRQLEMCDGALEAVTGICGVPGTTAGTYAAIVPGAAANEHSGEVLQFWHHLSAAELIPGFFNGQAGDGSAPENMGALGFSFPPSRLDRNGIGVFADGGRNYFQIGVIDGLLYEVEPSLTAEEAFNLDSKMDDGRPSTGSVIARSAQPGGTPINAPLAPADGADTGTSVGTGACVEVTGAIPPAPTDPSDPDYAADLATYNAAVRNAEYATLNGNVTCSVRFRMN